MVTIKKYSNRRLYDPDESRYITLDELASKVRAGVDVRVVDAQTGDDLTGVSLAQILMEGRGGARLLPVPLLVQLIRMGDDALAEFLGRYLSWALEVYVHAKQGAQSLASYSPIAGLPFAASNALARLMMGAVGWTPEPPLAPSASPAGEPSAQPPAGPGAEPSADLAAREEVAALRRELDEIKRVLRPRRRR